MTTLVARRLGDPGFVVFARALASLGVLDHAELVALLRLHGAVLRRVEPALDDGTDVDVVLVALARELGGEVA